MTLRRHPHETHHFGRIRAGVHRGEANALLQENGPGCPPSSGSKLSHIFPAAGSEMATLLSAPKAFIVLARALHNPTGNHAQHLANTC